MWIIILQNISTILPLKNSGGRNVAAIIYAIASGGIRRRGYVRIEHEAGGATHLAMSECDSDAIDKVADARANNGTNVERVPAKR